jgi:hypothetical protein
MLERVEIKACPVSFMGAWFLEDMTVCDDLIKYFQNNKDKQQPGEAGDPESFGPKIIPAIKDSVDMFFMPGEDIDVWTKYTKELEKCIAEYIQLYPRCTSTDRWGFYEATNLQFYPPGGGYKAWHSERVCSVDPYPLRHLVFMTYLNDVEDAGETEFLHQRVKIKPVKGLTLIWPADWTHFHRGIPSPTQEKYIITGWLSFLPKDVVDEIDKINSK